MKSKRNISAAEGAKRSYRTLWNPYEEQVYDLSSGISAAEGANWSYRTLKIPVSVIMSAFEGADRTISSRYKDFYDIEEVQKIKS